MGILKSEGYHIHFYCESNELAVGETVREKLVKELPEVSGAGSVRSTAIGPHPLPMFEAWFSSEHLDLVVRWAMANRQGLRAMIHPLSGDDLIDHREHALWIGTPLPLNLSIFTAGAK